MRGSTLRTATREPASRAVAREPHLFLAFHCEEPQARCDLFPLGGVKTVRIGRGDSSSSEIAKGALRIQVSDGFVSAEHARLRRDSRRWLVEDAGSSNGTLVNGEPVQERVLADGDLIEVGRTFFIFREALKPCAAAARMSELPGLHTLLPG